MQGVDVVAAARAEPAPAVGTAFEGGFPVPGLVGSAGSFELELVLLAFLRDDVDGTAGGVVIHVFPRAVAVDDFDALDGVDGNRHIQVIGGPAVGQAAFQILAPAVDEEGHAVIAVDADDLLRRIGRTGRHCHARGVVQGFGHAAEMVVVDIFGRDHGQGGRNGRAVGQGGIREGGHLVRPGCLVCPGSVLARRGEDRARQGQQDQGRQDCRRVFLRSRMHGTSLPISCIVSTLVSDDGVPYLPLLYMAARRISIRKGRQCRKLGMDIFCKVL